LEEEDGDCQADPEADLDDSEAGAPGFVNYMPDAMPAPAPGSGGSGRGPHPNANITPAPPGCDALNNQYVRVIHTNGIHHIALVGCTCRGKEYMISDLIYARMVPTSFERVRTIFTAAVLDHFRLCNLEMRSSAFQFFQMLRRVTLPISPSQAVNFYHELRRLSRLWRWIKKLKWSGYGQKPGEKIEPGAGDLSFYCAACPQPGINIPSDWKNSPNKWMFKRVFVVDGNFTADHVEQSTNEDIWLSDGTGMMARREEYKAFLEVAHSLSGVSGSPGPAPA
jgi:hypothetical protein